MTEEHGRDAERSVGTVDAQVEQLPRSDQEVADRIDGDPRWHARAWSDVWPPSILLGLLVFCEWNGLLVQLVGVESTPAIVVGGLKDGVLLVLLVLNLRLLATRLRAFWLGYGLIVVGCLLSLPAAVGIESAAYGFRNAYWPILLAPVAALVLRTEESATRLLRGYAYVTQVSLAFAVMTKSMGTTWLAFVGLGTQASGFPLTYFVQGSSTPRAFSPYGSPNELGFACVVALAVILFVPGLSWVARFALSILPVLACLDSQSRTAMLGIVLLVSYAVCVLALRTGSRWAIYTIGGAAIVLTLAVVVLIAYKTGVWPFNNLKRNDSSAVHFENLASTAQSIMHHPMGGGLGNFGSRARRYIDNAQVVESFVLLVPREIGLIGLAGYLAVMGWLLVSVVAARAKSHVWHVAPALVIALLPNQVLLPTLQEAPAAWQWWIVLGAVMACAGLFQRSDPQLTRRSRAATR